MRDLRSILVVEDDPDCREAIAEFLGICGYDVATAGDGEEALETLAGRPLPDLVLTDLRMPRLGGDGLVARMQGDARLAGLPVVMLTGSTEERAPEGAAGVVHKPFSPDELLRVLGRLFARAVAC